MKNWHMYFSKAIFIHLTSTELFCYYRWLYNCLETARQNHQCWPEYDQEGCEDVSTGAQSGWESLDVETSVKNTIKILSGINLQIRYLDMDDAGNYICEVENEAEPIKQTNTLQILGEFRKQIRISSLDYTHTYYFKFLLSWIGSFETFGMIFIYVCRVYCQQCTVLFS